MDQNVIPLKHQGQTFVYIKTSEGFYLIDNFPKAMKMYKYSRENNDGLEQFWRRFISHVSKT